MVEVRCIGLDDPVPEGFKYLSSWDCERLLCNNFDAFKDLDLSIDVGIYELINPGKSVRLRWLHGLYDDSYIDGDGRDLNGNSGVRGVLVCRGLD